MEEKFGAIEKRIKKTDVIQCEIFHKNSRCTLFDLTSNEGI
jgi:hypothetical protein